MRLFNRTGKSVCATDTDGEDRATERQRRKACLRQAGRCYRMACLVMREPGLMPKPLPPRSWPLGKTPLPVEGCGAGPLEPPPTTAVGGEPKVIGADGREPMYCEYARQKSV